MNSLYNKYRPKSFEEVVGNESTVVSLQESCENKVCPHVILFTGPTGCGKTTLARIVAKEVGAEETIEIDSAQFRGIDTVRDIRKQSQYVPLKGNVRAYIIDEVHQMSKDAQEGMLKILEDPPEHAYFILCTTEPQKLKPTLVGRCSQYSVGPLEEKELVKLLMKIVKGEGEKITKNVYDQIVGDSFGHPRNAIQILEQVLKAPNDRRISVAKKVAEQQSQSIELCRALIRGAGWKEISLILKGLKDEDPEGVRRHVLAYLQSVLLSESNDRVAAIMEDFLENFYSSGFAGLVYACYSATNG
ncbi:MAG: ATP-binding protein [Elusimicrobiota bacterium]